MNERRIGLDLARIMGFFFGCAEHGIWQDPDAAVDVWPVQWRLRAWHKGRHDFRPFWVAEPLPSKEPEK